MTVERIEIVRDASSISNPADNIEIIQLPAVISGVIASAVGALDAGGWFTQDDLEAITQALASRDWPHGHPTSGQYFRTAGNQTTAAAVQNRLCYTPIESNLALVLDRIGVFISTLAAASVVRLGVYASRSDGYPGARILDAGTIDASTGGYKEITINQATGAGRFWLAGVAQGGTPSTRILTNTKPAALGFQSAIGGINTSTLLLQTNPSWIFEDGINGALPAVATPTYDGAFINTISIAARAA